MIGRLWIRYSRAEREVEIKMWEVPYSQANETYNIPNKEHFEVLQLQFC